MAQITIERDGLQITIRPEVFRANTCAHSHELAQKRQARINVSVSEESPGGREHLLYVHRDVDLDFAMSNGERQGIINEVVDTMLRESRDEIDCMREARRFEREASEWLDSAVAESVNQHPE